MSEEEPQAVSGDVARHALRLTAAKRWLFGVASMLIWASAVFVLYRGQDGVAVLGLITIGSLFTLLAILGVVPQRIKSGEHVVELYELHDRREREIDVAAEVMDEAQLKEVAEAVQLEERGSFRVRSRFDDIIIFEAQAANVLREACQELRLALKMQSAGTGRLWDAEIQLADGRRCLVDVRASPPKPASLIRTFELLPNADDVLLVISRNAKYCRNILAQHAPSEGGRRFAVAAPTKEAIANTLRRLGAREG